MKKGVLPYKSVKLLQSLNVKKLPQKEEFNSSLSGMGITDEDYNHACKVWDNYYIKMLGEYGDLCLKVDVLLLE